MPSISNFDSVDDHHIKYLRSIYHYAVPFPSKKSGVMSDEMHRWVRVNIYAHWTAHKSVLYLNNEQDAALFKLFWG